MFRLRRALKILLLSSLAAIAPFTLDSVLPVASEIAHDINSTRNNVLAVSGVYLIVFGLSNYLYARIIYKYRAHIVVSTILLIFSIASIGLFQTKSFGGYYFWRILQGATIGICIVGAYAIAETTEKMDYGKSARRLALVLYSAGPMSAPLVGYGVGQTLGWRFVFIVQALVGLVFSFITWKLAGGVNTRTTRHTKKVTFEFREFYIISGFNIGSAIIFTAGFFFILISPDLIAGFDGAVWIGYCILFTPLVVGNVLGRTLLISYCKLKKWAIAIGTVAMVLAAFVEVELGFLERSELAQGAVSLLIYSFGCSIMIEGLVLHVKDFLPADRQQSIMENKWLVQNIVLGAFASWAIPSVARIGWAVHWVMLFSSLAAFLLVLINKQALQSWAAQPNRMEK